MELFFGARAWITRRGRLAGAVMCALGALQLFGVAGAQSPTPTSGEKSSASAICGEFQDAARLDTRKDNKASVEDTADRGFEQLTNASRIGLKCAEALAQNFDNLHKSRGKGTWTEIERQLDGLVGGFRQLVAAIEQPNGVYESGMRAANSLGSAAAEIAAARGETHETVAKYRQMQASFLARLEKTKTLKISLVDQLDDMAVRRVDIAETVALERYGVALKALDRFNGALGQVVESLAKEQRKPTGKTPGG